MPNIHHTVPPLPKLFKIEGVKNSFDFSTIHISNWFSIFLHWRIILGIGWRKVIFRQCIHSIIRQSHKAKNKHQELNPGVLFCSIQYPHISIHGGSTTLLSLQDNLSYDYHHDLKQCFSHHSILFVRWNINLTMNGFSLIIWFLADIWFFASTHNVIGLLLSLVQAKKYHNTLISSC